MENVWIFDFIGTIFFGRLGLVNFLILLIFGLAIYAGYVYLLSIFFRRNWQEIHQESLDQISGFYAQSVVGDAMRSVYTTIAFALAQLLRGLILPIKLLSGAVNSFLLGSVDKFLEKADELSEQISEKDAEKLRIKEEKASRRFVNDQINRAKMRQIKLEAKQARLQLRAPNFTGLEFEEKDDQKKESMTDAEMKLVSILADKCEVAFQNGSLENASIDSISKYLACSKQNARFVRKVLHQKGVLSGSLLGRMEFNAKKN